MDIACPTCQKKYRLGDRFPAEFACKSCGTKMDLSGFPGAVVAPAAPVVPAVAASAREEPEAGRPSSRTRAGAGRSRASARVAARRRSRDEDDDGDDDRGHRGRPPPRRGMSPALLWGSIGGMVVVVGLLVVVLKSKGGDEPTVAEKAGTGGMSAGTGIAIPGMGGAGTETPAGAGDAPAPTEGPAPVEPPKEGAKWYPSNKAEIKPKEHHPDATPEERQKIDELMKLAVFENAGSDSVAAEKALVEMGLKAAPRIVDTFATIKSTDTFENRMGLMKAAIADRMLRRIDGVIERKFNVKLTPIRASSDPKHAEKIAKIWNWWWDVEEWKKGHKPWDEKTEGKREDAEEGAKPAEGSKPPAPTGMEPADTPKPGDTPDGM
jgi:hypothetical protein